MGRAQGQSAKRQKLHTKARLKSPPPKPRFQVEEVDEDVKKSDDKGKVKEEPRPRSFKIIAGTYEKILYGLDAHASLSSTNQLEFDLKPIFAFPAHVSCIKAVAASPHGGKWLATGSADEIIKVWDLRRRKEIGGLMHHQGSITHLHFPSRSHLLSASEDGTLCLFHARDWSVLRAMKGHKARVNSIAVHPSGKVALSVGKDRTLRMWDLMRGKGCASTKLGKEGEIVRFSTDGSMFVVQSGSTMDIYDTAMNLLHTIIHSSRLHDVNFSPRVSGKDEVLLAGAEDKKLAVFEVSSDPKTPPHLIAELVGHDRRVKAFQTITVQLPSSNSNVTRQTTIIACTASSDGKIRLFDLALLPEPAADVTMEAETTNPTQITPVAEYDTKGTRLTCLTLADGDVGGDESGSVTGKRKHGERDADDGSSDDDDENLIYMKDDQDESEEEGEGEIVEEGETEDETWHGLGSNSVQHSEDEGKDKLRKQK